jgi:hypothetical protein
MDLPFEHVLGGNSEYAVLRTRARYWLPPSAPPDALTLVQTAYHWEWAYGYQAQSTGSGSPDSTGWRTLESYYLLPEVYRGSMDQLKVFLYTPQPAAGPFKLSELVIEVARMPNPN